MGNKGSKAWFAAILLASTGVALMVYAAVSFQPVLIPFGIMFIILAGVVGRYGAAKK